MLILKLLGKIQCHIPFSLILLHPIYLPAILRDKTMDDELSKSPILISKMYFTFVEKIGHQYNTKMLSQQMRGVYETFWVPAYFKVQCLLPPCCLLHYQILDVIVLVKKKVISPKSLKSRGPPTVISIPRLVDIK